MRTLVIARRVIKQILRDKRTLALVFIAPILILWLLNTMFSANNDVTARIGTVAVDQKVAKQMKKVTGITLKTYTKKATAQKALAADKLDGVIVYDQAAKKYEVTYANLDVSKTALTKTALKSALTATTITNLKTVVQKQSQLLPMAPQKPAKTVKIVNHYNYGDADSNFFNKIAPILMGFFTFFFVFLISGMALLKERTSGTLARLLATPVKRSEIVYGYMLGYGLLALLQASLIAIVGIYLLNIEVVGSLLSVVAISVLLGFVALASGILMSTFAASEFQLMQFIPIVVVPQIFFSGIIPLDSMVNWAQVIGKLLPLTYAGDALTAIIMQGASLVDVWYDIMILISFLVVLVLLNVVGLRRYRKV